MSAPLCEANYLYKEIEMDDVMIALSNSESEERFQVVLPCA